MPKDDLSNLFHLVWFCLTAPWLDVDDLCDIRTEEDMMTGLDALLKTESAQKLTQVRKSDVGVRCSAENPLEDLFMAGHPDSSLRG